MRVTAKYPTIVSVSLLAAMIGCDQRTNVIEPPPPDTTGNGGGGGTVQRVSFTVRVAVHGEAAEVATALGGSSSGALAGAQVTITRSGGGTDTTALSDSDGRVVFNNLLPGNYTVSVVRLLTADEQQRLDANLRDIGAFGGGGSTQIEPPSETFAIEATAGRRGSLVISEVFDSPLRRPEGFYYFANYLELYNNADTTVYLDGKVIVMGPSPGAPVQAVYTTTSGDAECTTYAPWRLDPDGIWAGMYVAIPGSGNEHPLGPGRTAYIATDAIDHTEFWQGAPNLSAARFEGIGANDIDNPAVPNLVNLGPRSWDSVSGHGWFLNGGVLAIAESVDPAALQKDQIPDRPYPEVHLIPAEKILDVVTVVSPDVGQVRWCNPVTNPAFDAGAAPLQVIGTTDSGHRKVLARLPSGQLLLQRTKTSRVDFSLGPKSPGTVP